MKARGSSKAANSADLLVCFPSRAHLTLMPKPICSPARHSESNKRSHHRHNHHQHLKRSTTKRQGNSPVLWAKSKAMNPDISEPTSPKVTCSGQIKVRHKNSTATCKNWQSVMEEIERIHNSKQKKKTTWVEALGFKKEVLQFLSCLRSAKFDFRCFGSFPESDITSGEDEDEDEEDEEDESQENHHDDNIVHSENSGAVFSKWFMLLEDEPSNELATKDDMVVSQAASSAPPPNALLLMRCRSAPAKNRFKDEDETDKEKEMEQEEEANSDKEKSMAPEEEKKKKRESLMVVMKYDTDFYKLSCDIAEETWVTGGMNGPFSRSRSWKR